MSEPRAVGDDRRANYLGVPAAFNLNQACRIITEAFGEPPYLVGSCLTRRDFRDVDLRLILDDAEFDALFPGVVSHPHLTARWSLVCAAISEWLAARTGLPIDFQIQKQSMANKDYDGPRQAIGIFLEPRMPKKE